MAELSNELIAKLKKAQSLEEITGLLEADGQDVAEAEKTWYRNLPLPREYRAHDGPDNGTLSGIALLFYGNGSKWKNIWEANKATLPNPNIVRPGLKLKIPALNPDPAKNGPVPEDSHVETATP